MHIRERHWIDLSLIELLTVIFWFNPFSWLFERAIKQNHEYLADQGVLKSGKSPVRYQALLVNQLMGMQVIGITNNLNFAIGPTRLKMMTKQKTPKLKLLHLLWALPAIVLLLTAFAEPEYKKPNSIQSNSQVLSQPLSSNQQNARTVTGNIILENGDPLSGAHIVLAGTTMGTVSDENGEFKLEIPENIDNPTIYTSYVGYKFKEIEIPKAIKSPQITQIMEREVIGTYIEDVSDETLLPENPYVPQQETYADEVFVLVENMPEYPGGSNGLTNYFKKKYKEVKSGNFFEGEKLEGEAMIQFTVSSTGKVTNIIVLESTTDLAGETLASMAAGMDDWEPGYQGETPVPVDFAMKLEF